MSKIFLLRKNRMYYAHNDCGYVSRALLAEIYDEEYALKYASQHEDIEAVPLTDAITSREEVQEYINRIQIMFDALPAIKEESK